MADEKQMSALFRRNEQLKRWEDSETNRVSSSIREERLRVKFQDGCIFLAACSSSDTEEVKKLLDRGADINTSNIDGLTALHQACIDDNQDMVEFLVDNGAEVDVCDNEGWTPLHATASCGFTEIARYLIKRGANVAAVNNDGDLPMDICEDEEMENLLQKEMDEQGIDAELARQEEEERMLADANQWLNSKNVKEKKHTKTGATALHVAAAKSYIKVMEILIQAGVDVNARDNDGWTPLHAAAHWGQEESCQILVDNMCDMDIKNNAGQSAFELADAEMVRVLEDLKKKQITLRDKAPTGDEIISTKGSAHKRRSSVTRMSGDQKANVILKASEEERAALFKTSDDKETRHSDEEDHETERQNKINKKSSTTAPTSLEERPTILKPEMPKIDEDAELTGKLPTSSSVTPTVTNEKEGSPRSNSTSAVEESKPDSFKSYEPPKRDEETETQRRVKAKRARETRRSTQGVSLEDLEKATGEVKKSDDKNKDQKLSQDQTDAANSRVSANIPSSTEDSTTSTRRRAWDDKKDEETSSRSSIRRTREPRDTLANSTDYTSAYIPRSQRNALSTSDINNTSLGGSSNLSRSSSTRSRLRNGEVETKEVPKENTEESKRDKSNSERGDTPDGEKKETSAIRSRRLRRERRSTGIVDYNPENEEGEKEKENKPDEDKKESEDMVFDKLAVLRNSLRRYNLSSRPYSGSGTSSYGTSDSGRYSSRPASSYNEYSRSTTSLDSDYKKLYEEEKSSNEKLRKELEQCKQELRDAKKELDRVMRKNNDRTEVTNDKREKRALERKLSEMEEELKKMEVLKNDNARLKEENGALIRVISKLSK
ncbi:protein phosphatase 1 regulatory subunit 12A isoform X11 [Patella vulgata]|uniref:protein phosphatase 1 regulatory subunit 12A isoform X11 n=1 Tax=Patella vulgata TaxID=6465 RepID=UPI0024A9B1A3|nr:protein phosphatase 1 regulatory subunit 12A isoform X11 [Patella vulgata]